MHAHDDDDAVQTAAWSQSHNDIIILSTSSIDNGICDHRLTEC